MERSCALNVLLVTELVKALLIATLTSRLLPNFQLRKKMHDVHMDMSLI